MVTFNFTYYYIYFIDQKIKPAVKMCLTNFSLLLYFFNYYYLAGNPVH